MAVTPIQVGIVGASGYTGMELMRLLFGHPEVRLHCASSDSAAGQRIADCLPAFEKRTSLRFSPHTSRDFDDCELVFIAAPESSSMAITAQHFQQGKRVIDLSANFRLRDPQCWEQWYGQPHRYTELLPQAVYGLPELYRERLREARLIANPGCYPTAICLALLPLLQSGYDLEDIVADAKSGISGAGRKATPERHFCEIAGGFHAYAASGHRHLPEIRQVLEEQQQQDISLCFVPHLLPVSRGLAATLYVHIRQAPPLPELQALYSRYYQDEPFVRYLPAAGAHPDIRHVRGSNLCQLALHHSPGQQRTVILSVIDNLVKGAAGQAVQNMNIACGFLESTGLEIAGLVP